MILRPLAAVLLIWAGVTPSPAQEARALARAEIARSALVDEGRGVSLSLVLSQAVPYRVALRDDPMRVVLDFRDVQFGADLADLDRSEGISRVTLAAAPVGWSRLELHLASPMEVTEAGLEAMPQTGRARVALRLVPVSRARFEQRTKVEDGSLAAVERVPQPRDEGLVVMLDAGHGGADPGAVRGPLREADIALAMALALREALLRSGVDQVVLTRRTDRLMSIAERLSLIAQSEADLLLSLHAGAGASEDGVVIHTLSAEAATLAAQDVWVGDAARSTKEGQTGDINAVLSDLAQRRNRTRLDRLLPLLSEEIGDKAARRARQEGAARILGSAAIPSVLIELGNMSSAQDQARLADPLWRAELVEAMRKAILRWRDLEAVFEQ